VKSYIANLQTPNQSTISSRKRRVTRTLISIAVLLLISASVLTAQITPGLGFLPSPIQVVSTVPSNGDVNPYGVAFVPSGFPGGVLNPGDVLVSNFNNSQNLQGTGTTIVRVLQQGPVSVFFTASPQQPGLSTALAVLQEGLVIVGSFPSVDGTCATAGNGALLVINSLGMQVQTIADQNYINGPWDMTVHDFGGGKVDAFIANGLSGAITRFNMTISGGALTVQSKTTIASGYLFQCDPVTFVDAPTGLVYDPKKDILYVASTADNTIFAVSKASQRNDDGGTGTIIYQDQTHLHGPLGMVAAPNGHLLVANNDAINPDPNQPSEIVEFTLSGHFVKQISMDPAPGGSFGLDVMTAGLISRFAAVDDNQSTLNIWTLPTH
jgi:Arylesterase